jgi:hypothetical protein
MSDTRAIGVGAFSLILIGALATPRSGQAQGAVGATFTKITEGQLVTELANWTTNSWGDYDGDGDLDAFFGAQIQSTRNYLYRNDGAQGFTLLDVAAMPKIASNQHGAAWGDTDNDGDLDLIVTSGQPEVGSNMLYLNNGDGTFSWTDTAISQAPFVNGFHSPTWGDYDNDGFIDLFIGAHDTHNHLFRNNGDGSFSKLASHVLINDAAMSEGRAWVDYDGDGDIDLHVTNLNAAGLSLNALYRNDGAGSFVRVLNSGLNSVLLTSGACWADYDNDGRQDVFLTHDTKNSLFHNNGGVFSLVATSAPELEPLPLPTTIYTSCAWGDYDNDGFIDLAVGMADITFPEPNPNRTLLFRNRGDGTFEKVTAGAVVDELTGVGIMSWVDYDNDGFLDLAGARGIFAPTPRTATLFHNDGNTNAWLNVKLVGTVSNRSAIGAKVRVNAFFSGASRSQLREIFGGDSIGNMQSLNAEFGLADATVIDTLRVEWPSGIVQELHDVAPRQFLTITEASPSDVPAIPRFGLVMLCSLLMLSAACILRRRPFRSAPVKAGDVGPLR